MRLRLREPHLHHRLQFLLVLSDLLDWRLFRAANWRLSALAVDPQILQLAGRGFKAVERLERQIYTQFEEEAAEEGALSY